MTRLADLELLLRTADLGSLSAAAKALDWTPAAASAAVKRLEAQWGAQVFVRSTRSLRLSAQGERLLPHVRAAMQSMEQARLAAVPSAELRGELQVSMPSDLGRNVLPAHLERFQERHPNLSLQLHLSDSTTDLMRMRMDVAIRYGAPPSSGLVALPLAAHNRRVLVAAPAYIKRCGLPQSASELQSHEALRFMLSGAVPKAWHLCIDGHWQDVPVHGKRSSNDGELVKRWALAGLGVAYKSQLDVAAELASGQLQLVQPTWLGEPAPLYLIVPGKGQFTPAARALRDWLLAQWAAPTAQQR